MCDSSSAISSTDAAQRRCRPTPSRCSQLLCMMTEGPTDNPMLPTPHCMTHAKGERHQWKAACWPASVRSSVNPTSRDGWHACIATETQTPCRPFSLQRYKQRYCTFLDDCATSAPVSPSSTSRRDTVPVDSRKLPASLRPGALAAPAATRRPHVQGGAYPDVSS